MNANSTSTNQGDLFFLRLVAEPYSTTLKDQGDGDLNAKVEGSDEIVLASLHASR